MAYKIGWSVHKNHLDNSHSHIFECVCFSSEVGTEVLERFNIECRLKSYRQENTYNLIFYIF